MFWFTTWMVLNIVVTLLNKTFFSILKCPYPSSVTMVHMIFSGVLSHYALVTKYTDTRPIPAELNTKLNWMSFLFVANIVLGNAALSFCSIAFVQMVRCTIPAMTAFMAYFILGSKLTNMQMISLLPVIFGAVMVSLGELDLTFVGVVMTLAGCAASALKSILTKVFLSGS